MAEFLRRHPEFRLVDQVLQVPPDRECDGAFAAAIEFSDPHTPPKDTAR